MFDTMNTSAGGTPWAPLYFVSFVTMATFVVLNLFVMIIVEDFDELDRQNRGMTSDHLDVSIPRTLLLLSNSACSSPTHTTYCLASLCALVCLLACSNSKCCGRNSTL